MRGGEERREAASSLQGLGGHRAAGEQGTEVKSVLGANVLWGNCCKEGPSALC